MTRPALAVGGAAVLGVAWTGPLPELARASFAAHMTLHMAVVAVAAPLLALGVAGGRLDPARRWPSAFPAIPASVVELAVVWAWHAPALHRVARGDAAAFAVEQASFLAAGLFLWVAALGGERGDVGRRAAGVVGLLLTAMHMTLLGALLALAPRPLYAHLHGDGGGLSPLADQHLGGAVMLVVGGVAYLAGGLGLTAGLLRGREARVQGAGGGR